MSAFLLVLFVLFAPSIECTAARLSHFSIDPTALSVTGFSYRPAEKNPLLWVARVLGDRAVYWNISRDVLYETNSSEENIPAAMEQFIRFKPPQHQHLLDSINSCAIEMLGFVRVGKHAPFRGAADRRLHPSVGIAALESTAGFGNWTCHYRAMYSNRRVSDAGKKTFWTVAFYCPAALESTECTAMQSVTTDTSTSFHLTMNLLHEQQWRAEIAVELTMTPIDDNPFKKEAKGSREAMLAVCTVWPYVTSHPEKRTVNAALVFEFLRYYTALGIRLIVFDRDGANMKQVMESPYAKALSNNTSQSLFNAYNSSSGGSSSSSLIDYHNYTILSQLLDDDDSSGPVTSDMEQGVSFKRTIKRVELLDDDKEHTYSHCRFHAAQQYDIERVLVVDFDEFIHCKDIKSMNGIDMTSIAAQREHIEGAINAMQQRGKEQLLLGKATVAKRYNNSTMLQCMQREIDRAVAINTQQSLSPIANRMDRMGSIFQCFASSQYTVEIPNVKSFHLNRACPFTGLHHACSPKRHQQHVYDCVCSTAALPGCSVLHLSIVEDKYLPRPRRKNAAAVAATVADFDQQEKRNPSELWQLLNPDSPQL